MDQRFGDILGKFCIERQHARANAPKHIILGLLLEDQRVDARAVQQLPEQQSGGAGADDDNLRAFEYVASSARVRATRLTGGDIISSGRRTKSAHRRRAIQNLAGAFRKASTAAQASTAGTFTGVTGSASAAASLGAGSVSAIARASMTAL